jgi:hypothetical protein
VLLAIAAYLAAFTVIYFNVVLIGAADAAMRGEEPDVSASKDMARSRVRSIAVWALVSAVVSVVLRALRGRGNVAGDVVAGIGAERGRWSRSSSCRSWPSRASGRSPP